MAQVARNLTDGVDGFLRDMQFSVVDNDVPFAKQFCAPLEGAHVQVVRTAIQAPNMKASAKRFVPSIERERLRKASHIGEGHLRRILCEFVKHYHAERPHQGIDNKLIAPTNNEPPNGNRVVGRERIGGLRCSDRRSA